MHVTNGPLRKSFKHEWCLRNLESNLLNGTIPSILPALRNLTQVKLWNNTFTSTIPPSLGNISRLFHLDLGRNNFTGTVCRARLRVSSGWCIPVKGLSVVLRIRHWELCARMLIQCSFRPRQLFIQANSIVLPNRMIGALGVGCAQEPEPSVAR